MAKPYNGFYRKEIIIIRIIILSIALRDLGEVITTDTPGLLTWGICIGCEDADFEDVTRKIYPRDVTIPLYMAIYFVTCDISEFRFYISGCDYPQVGRPGVSDIWTSPRSRDSILWA